MEPPSVRVQVSTVIGMRRLVAQTDLLTRRDLLAGSEGTQLVEVDVPELQFERQFGVLAMRDTYMTMAARRMVQLLISQSLA
jgi:hypothetical protein